MAVIASEARQSMPFEFMDCRVAALLAMTACSLAEMSKY